MARCVSPVKIKIPYIDWSENAIKERIYNNKEPFFFQGFVPCGKCYNCLSKRRASWVFRLNQELSNSFKSYFITFTRNEEYNLLKRNELDKKEMQTYIKQLRKYNNFKYYLIGEYGTTTRRAHYHAIFFQKDNDENFINRIKYYYACFENVNGQWQRQQEKGLISIYEVTEKMVGYISHYHIRPKDAPNNQKQNAFALCSQGLGANFLENEKIHEYVKKSGSPIVHDLQGNSFVLPRYYRKKYNLEIKDKNKYSYHQIFKNRNEYIKFKKLSIEDQLRKIRELKMSSNRRLDNYNKQIKSNTL